MIIKKMIMWWKFIFHIPVKIVSTYVKALSSWVAICGSFLLFSYRQSRTGGIFGHLSFLLMLRCIYFILFFCVWEHFACMCVCTMCIPSTQRSQKRVMDAISERERERAHTWRSEDNLVELVFSVYFYVSMGAQTQANRLEQQVCFHTEPSHQPWLLLETALANQHSTDDYNRAHSLHNVTFTLSRILSKIIVNTHMHTQWPGLRIRITKGTNSKKTFMLRLLSEVVVYNLNG